MSSFICDFGVQMTSGHYADYRDDVFRCNIRWKKKPVRMRNIFTRSRLTVRQVLIIFENWITKAPATLSATFPDAAEAPAVQ